MQVFIGSVGRMYGSTNEYIPLADDQDYKTEYEIVMSEEEALNRPDRECNGTDVPPNFSLCVERALGKLVNCSLGMMSRLDDDSGPLCDRESKEFRDIRKSGYLKY